MQQHRLERGCTSLVLGEGHFVTHAASATVGTHVATLAARISSFPPEAVSRAKRSVLAAGPDVHAGLVEEAFLFQETLRTDAAQRRMRNFLERGGQTVEGESRVGALGTELG